MYVVSNQALAKSATSLIAFKNNALFSEASFLYLVITIRLASDTCIVTNYNMLSCIIATCVIIVFECVHAIKTNINNLGKC